MALRRIGREGFGFRDVCGGRHSPLDDPAALMDWFAMERHPAEIGSAVKGEAVWPPPALFKAMLIAIWYDISDVRLAEALEDRSSFRRFCGFSEHEATPERTAFVRFREALTLRGLDKTLFDHISAQLKTKAIRVKTGATKNRFGKPLQSHW